MVEYRPLPGSTLGELTANFDIRLGVTAQELGDGTHRRHRQSRRLSRATSESGRGPARRIIRGRKLQVPLPCA